MESAIEGKTAQNVAGGPLNPTGFPELHLQAARGSGRRAPGVLLAVL